MVWTLGVLHSGMCTCIWLNLCNCKCIYISHCLRSETVFLCQFLWFVFDLLDFVCVSCTCSSLPFPCCALFPLLSNLFLQDWMFGLFLPMTKAFGWTAEELLLKRSEWWEDTCHFFPLLFSPAVALDFSYFLNPNWCICSEGDSFL